MTPYFNKYGVTDAIVVYLDRVHRCYFFGQRCACPVAGVVYSGNLITWKIICNLGCNFCLPKVRALSRLGHEVAVLSGKPVRYDVEPRAEGAALLLEVTTSAIFFRLVCLAHATIFRSFARRRHAAQMPEYFKCLRRLLPPCRQSSQAGAS